MIKIKIHYPQREREKERWQCKSSKHKYIGGILICLEQIVFTSSNDIQPKQQQKKTNP